MIDRPEPYRAGFALWSILFIQSGDKAFPDPRWCDATSSVLCIWMNNVSSLLIGSKESVLLPFMEGDYTLVLTRQPSKTTHMAWFAPGNTILREQMIDLSYFVRQLLAAVEKMRNAYPEHRNAPQIRELSNCADKLRKAFFDSGVLDY